MSLKEIIFTNGQINCYQKEDKQLLVDFIDYQNRKIKILFQGVISFKDHNCLKTEFADYKISADNDLQKLILMDDERSILFEVVFETASYKVEND